MRQLHGWDDPRLPTAGQPGIPDGSSVADHSVIGRLFCPASKGVIAGISTGLGEQDSDRRPADA
jgi:hypothetical protein